MTTPFNKVYLSQTTNESNHRKFHLTLLTVSNDPGSIVPIIRVGVALPITIELSVAGYLTQPRINVIPFIFNLHSLILY